MSTRLNKSAPEFGTEIKSFVRAYSKELAAGNAALFAGAGLSVAGGFVDWRGLMREIADELGLNVDREENLISVAQFHYNERQNRSRLNQRIIEEFSTGHRLTENHSILARLPIHTYWTTNYDKLIENALIRAGKTPDVKHTIKQLKTSVPNRDAVVYKMHGDVEHPDEATLTKDDYEGYFRDRELYVTALSGDLVSKTFLFLGFSFSDPNIDYVMSRVRVTLRRAPKQHYCILRREQRKTREKTADFEYRKRKQAYLIKDLNRIGVQALMVDDYSAITEILRAVEAQYLRQTVFISGSACDFGSWSPDAAAQFIDKLSSEIISRGMTIVTGFGLGVGPSVIGGALRTILENPSKYSAAQLIAKPFPVGAFPPHEAKRVYKQYRQEMVENVGIAIFLFGNKSGFKRKVVLADGVMKEFQLAVDSGVKPIPVACTGFASAELWKKVAASLDSYYPNATRLFKRNFSELAQATPSVERVLRAILQMVDELRKG